MRKLVLSRMATRTVVALLLLVAAAPVAYADEPQYDGTSFVGLPAYARDGAEVGEVVGETKDPEGLPETLHVAVAQKLGLGERVIEVGRGRYVGLRGVVTLDYVADAVENLPAVPQ